MGEKIKISLFIFILQLAFWSLSKTCVAAIPAFPGAEGFGAYSKGGRGGVILKVTNLNDSGPGSLRAAVEASGPRIVVFETSGIIDLESNLTISHPYITIAGQTSPGGILVAGRTTIINTHDVIIQHVRFRLGSHHCAGASDAETMDVLDIMGDNVPSWFPNKAYNIIIDHCSFSWGIDELVDIGLGATDVTLSWCIFSEALSHAGHPKGEHSKGVLISGKYGGNSNVSLHHNYFAHNYDRNPLVGASDEYPVFADVVNNVIYNFHGNLSMISQMWGNVNWIYNYVKRGPDSNDHAFEAIYYPGGVSRRLIYAFGNIGIRRQNQEADQWCVGHMWYDQYESQIYRRESPWPCPQVTTTPMSYEYALRILDKVGATRPVRDSVDARVVSDFASSTGHVIDNVKYPDDFPTFQNLSPPRDSDDDGMPDVWESSHGLNPYANDSAEDEDGDGYTNIEEYLFALAGLLGDDANSPASNAGQDQTVTDSDGDGHETVTLDGTGSSDPDGTIVSYVWKENGEQIAQGATAEVQLAVGIHDITLEVTDNDGATDTDTVRITVQSSNGNSLAISDVSALSPTDQNVTIKWITDQPANGKVEYGIDTNYGQETSTDSNFSNTHCIVLTGLSANTTYHYRVISQDGSGHSGVSEDHTFTTLAAQSDGHTYVWIEAEDGIINAPMQIETDNSASSGKYITTPQGTGNTTKPSAEAVYDVDIRQTGDYYIWIRMYGPGGDNDALYVGPNGNFDRVYPDQWNNYEWIRVETVHNSGNYVHHLQSGINRIAVGHGEELARADRILITTDPSYVPGQDNTPPGDVTNLQAVPGPAKVTFSWTNPTDSDFAGVMIRYRTDGTYPEDMNDGYAVPNGNNGKITGNPGQNMSYVHDNLDPTKHYYYSFFTYDTSGNYSHTAHVDVQPLPTNHDPVINSFVVSPTSLNNPYETATFTASATDEDGDTLSYEINFGDGNFATGNNVTHAYTSAGQYTATLTVSDGNGGISTRQLTITVNDLPPAAPTGVTVSQ